jgi:ankyrin repeat protein
MGFSLLQTNVYGELPTHRAGTVEVLDWLGMNANVPYMSEVAVAASGSSVSRGQLPVHAAAMRGDIEALAWLHAHGESMQAVATDTGQHPAHFAAASKSLDALVWLGNRESVPAFTFLNATVCHRVVVYLCCDRCASRRR